MRTRILRPGVVALAIVAIAVQSPPATAGPLDSTVADPAVVSLAKEHGLSLADAAERIDWQHRASVAKPVIEHRLGDSFAGMWADEPGGGRINISVSGDVRAARAVLAETGVSTFTDVVLVQHSMAELQAIRDQVMERLRPLLEAAPGAQASVGASPERNVVEVSLPARGFDELSAERVASSLTGSFGEAVAVELSTARMQRSECVEPYCDPPLRAGVRIHNGHSSCTSGFPARSRSDNKLYLMTAGHCGAANPNAAWYSYQTNGNQRTIGRTLEHRRVHDGTGDMQIVAVNNPAGWNTRAWVFVRDGAETVRNKQYPITRDTNPQAGWRVCMAGAATGTHCGSVTQPNSCFFIDGRFVCDIASATYRSRNGDSGAPVFGYNWAYGLNVGFVPGTAISYFHPIRVVENRLNVNVAHHNG